VTIIAVSAIINQVSGGTLALLTAILAVTAASATTAVWRDRHGSATAVEAAEKAKRHSRVERLMEQLDDRDIAELRARLAANEDGDAVPLEDLLRRQSRDQ
jgi:hypothetical protein